MSKTSKKNISRKYRLKRKTLKRRYSTKKRYRASSQRSGGSSAWAIISGATKQLATKVMDSGPGIAAKNVLDAVVDHGVTSFTAMANSIISRFRQFNNNNVFKSTTPLPDDIEDTATNINFDSHSRTLFMNKPGLFATSVTIDLCNSTTISSSTITRTKIKTTLLGLT